MQKLLVITVMLAFATPGCLDGFRESLVSCDNITGECKYEILRGNEYSRLHIEVNYVTGNAPDSDALNLLKPKGIKAIMKKIIIKFCRYCVVNFIFAN